MSQYGNLVFYLTHPNADAVDGAREVLNRSGMTTPIAFYARKAQREWSWFLRDTAYYDSEQLDREEGTEAHLARYRRPGCLHLFGASTWADRIHGAVMDGLTPEVRGRYDPCQMDVHLGGHDIWECAEAPQGRLFGRAMFSVSFFGYGCPDHWTAFRSAVFELDGVKEVRAELEDIIGPVEAVVYWSI